MITKAAGIGTVRVFAAQRFLIGATLLVRPDAACSVVAAGETLPPAWLVRVLGGQVLCQGLLEWRRPSRTLLLAGATFDVIHAISMFAIAVLLPAYRRSAIASATEATASAKLQASFARQLP